MRLSCFLFLWHIGHCSNTLDVVGFKAYSEVKFLDDALDIVSYYGVICHGSNTLPCDMLLVMLVALLVVFKLLTILLTALPW